MLSSRRQIADDLTWLTQYRTASPISNVNFCIGRQIDLIATEGNAMYIRQIGSSDVDLSFTIMSFVGNAVAVGIRQGDHIAFFKAGHKQRAIRGISHPADVT